MIHAAQVIKKNAFQDIQASPISIEVCITDLCVLHVLRMYSFEGLPLVV